MKAYCKYLENSPILEFGPGPKFFNHVASDSPPLRASIRKQLTDSLEIVVEGGKVDRFKLTNQHLITWDDHWVDDSGMSMVDPGIKHVNIQRNDLVYVNINLPRPSLETLNVEGNPDLEHLYIHEAPRLEKLDISNCRSLKYISLGVNYGIKELIARDCQMTTEALEQLLRDFRPVYTASANVKGLGMFRKQYETVLDLRGNFVDWNNRRIASKIRILLTNNWVVRWDNNPPPEIIPPSLYGFFVESTI